MVQRHVLFTFAHAPFGTVGYAEGLRAALGATSGVEEHTIEALYLGDGVYFALRGLDRSDTSKYLEALFAQGVRPKVERESLEARGIAREEVAEDLEIIPRSEVLALLARADHIIDF